ncbi:MAG: hypothetical protein K8W52_21215 [Deltaproteobacteria bacterium]|nr:hypothetical protein [Deltaproteobacteria bacterium]
MNVINRTALVLSFLLAAACGDGGHHAATTPAAAAATPADPVLTALAARRNDALARLDAYAARAQFPVDDDGLPVGIFRDRSGVRCPMAEVIQLSGRADLVDTVARTDNHLKLATVHDGPLMDWMRGSGLTHEEIVMVQGAMNWSTANMEGPNGIPHEMIAAMARQQVKGRVMADIAVLRAQTAGSVVAAAARLSPAERLAILAAPPAKPASAPAVAALPRR